MRVAYVRVSTAEQNEERQLEALERFNIERWYTEKISGKNTNRPKLQEELKERAAREDYPFNIELPDGTIAADRDEVEEWYARNGGKI